MQAGTCELELVGREARLDDATYGQGPTVFSGPHQVSQSVAAAVFFGVRATDSSQLFSVGAPQVPVVVVLGRSCCSFRRGG
ncbi:hypothetical protein CGLO_06792 [Colletotrichum gloeosporioides Cg-14]|uniref:Uncharacterized protein n=1 Tax=Colletotrichum gloeosporioides (strain Cg-14) TaxID=1237896 RepID=T0KDK1_COLGC|nr:hypothetical protein CGLO_06792 [Colletotrichum gloeosporioides Cg-14]